MKIKWASPLKKTKSENGRKEMPTMTLKSKVSLAFTIIAIIIAALFARQIVENVRSGHFIIKQAAISGTMTAHFSEGWFMQLFGQIFEYPNSDTFYFSADEDQGGKKDDAIPVTFKNGSIGMVSGSARMTYPRSEKSVIELHRRYRSHMGVREDLVRTEIRKLVNMTASLMSPEAAMTQKGLFQQMFVDQVQHGQYQTEAAIERFEDPITKEISYKDVVKIKYQDGKQLRLENPFEKWGVSISQEVIQSIEPDEKTRDMIAKRRDAEMNVMVAKADVEKARQEEQKVIAEGKKKVAEKEYGALQEKIQAVVNANRVKQVAEIKAEQELAVARLARDASEVDKQKAEFEKQSAILRGEGEAEARKVIMAADGNMNIKIDALKFIASEFAKAYATRQVPSIVSGGGGNQDNQTLSFMELITSKFAKDLALDMAVQKK